MWWERRPVVCVCAVLIYSRSICGRFEVPLLSISHSDRLLWGAEPSHQPTGETMNGSALQDCVQRNEELLRSQSDSRYQRHAHRQTDRCERKHIDLIFDWQMMLMVRLYFYVIIMDFNPINDLFHSFHLINVTFYVIIITFLVIILIQMFWFQFFMYFYSNKYHAVCRNCDCHNYRFFNS